MKVNVAMITYNHAPYLRQALDSVLMQECDFEYECVVGDDCSTDGTQAILTEYAERHPDRVRPILRERNLGSQRNLADVLDRCGGQYLAYLEGDDYWTSPHKLQRQVDFMDANPECTVSFHGRTAVYEGQPPEAEPAPYEAPARSGVEELVMYNFISACTVMYRWGVVPQLPGWWPDVWIGDLTLHVLHADKGWVGYIDEDMAAYRIHAGGLWSGKGVAERVDALIKVLRLLDRTLGRRYHDAIERSVFQQNVFAAFSLLKDGQPRLSRRFFRDAVRHSAYATDIVKVENLKRLSRDTHAPRLSRWLADVEHNWERLMRRIGRSA